MSHPILSGARTIASLNTARGDLVTLHRTRDEVPSRSRFVFTVEGRALSGVGAVGGAIEWRHTNGVSANPWQPEAVPVRTVWVDAHAYDAEDTPLTVNGVRYRYGIAVRERERHNAPPEIGSWVSTGYTGLQREDAGRMTDAARSRLWDIMNAARDIYVSAVPRGQAIRDSLTAAAVAEELESQNHRDNADAVLRRLASL